MALTMLPLKDTCTCSQKVLLSNRTYQDLRGYAHALGTSLRELVDDSLRFCVLCGCVGVIGEGVCVLGSLPGPR